MFLKNLKLRFYENLIIQTFLKSFKQFETPFKKITAFHIHKSFVHHDFSHTCERILAWKAISTRNEFSSNNFKHFKREILFSYPLKNLISFLLYTYFLDIMLLSHNILCYFIKNCVLFFLPSSSSLSLS